MKGEHKMKLHSPDVAVQCSDEALTYLKEGNARFVSGNVLNRADSLKADLKVTSGGQKPFAAVITCADSRTSPELYFDQKLGDIFVCRNAGNVADDSVIGSLEFGVLALGVKVIVVVGHTACGAVDNSFKKTPGLPATLTGVLEGIYPGISSCPDTTAAYAENARVQAAKIAANPAVKETGVPVLPAVYDLATGEVKFV